MKKKGKDRIRDIFYGMKQRCYNPNCRLYHRYGGRGIKICDEWLNSIDSFVEWSIANNYSDELTIDRINNDGDYSPDNCRWATWKQQENNKSQNVFIEFMGQRKTMMEWCEYFGVDWITFYERYHERGYTFEQAMFMPKQRIPQRLYTINGVTKNLFQWCKEYNMEYNRVYKRLIKGYDIETALKDENLRTNGDMFKMMKERRKLKYVDNQTN